VEFASRETRDPILTAPVGSTKQPRGERRFSALTSSTLGFCEESPLVGDADVTRYYFESLSMFHVHPGRIRWQSLSSSALLGNNQRQARAILKQHV